MNTACRLFPESLYLLPHTAYPLFEIPRYARNDGVMYETGNAAAVNAEPLFCSCAAATIESGQRVIPSVARSLKQGGGFVPRCTRGAVSAGGADTPVRWDSCRLDFFAYFFYQEKKYEEKKIRYEVSGERYEVSGERYEVSCSAGDYLGSVELHCKVSSINWNKVAGVGQSLAGGGGCGAFGGGAGFTYWDSSIGGSRDITKQPRLNFIFST